MKALRPVAVALLLIGTSITGRAEIIDRIVAIVDAQIVTLGARVVGVELAKSVVSAFLGSEFAGGASVRKVQKLRRLDELAERPA